MVESYFRELKKYSLSEIAQRLGENNLSKLRKALSGQMYVVEEKGQYSFGYVGVLVIGDYVFRCFPKYMPDVIDDELEDKFKRILKVIKKVVKETPKLDWGEEDNEDYNFLQLAIALIEDYYAYGLYTNSREYIEEDGDGETLWDETPIYNTPIYIRGSYIYDSVLTLDVDIDEADFVQDIHKIVLSECSQKLYERDLLDIFNIAPVFLTDKKIKDIGSPKYVINRLEKELSSQYVTQKQNIIRLLIKYIASEYTSGKSGVKGYLPHSYYGVELFWPVWEEVCRRVFDGDITRKIMDLPISEDYKQTPEYQHVKNKKLAEIIEKPLWIKESTDDSGVVRELKTDADTYKPDLICIYKSDSTADDNSMQDYVFAILDAKYYFFDIIPNEKTNPEKPDINAQFSSDGNHPGLEDITKQFLYQQAYKPFVNLQGYGTFFNAFLCPIDEETYRFGRVKFDLIQSMVSPDLKDIYIIRINADEVYRRFLAKKKIDNINEYLSLN